MRIVSLKLKKMIISFLVQDGRIKLVNGCASYYELGKVFADSVTKVVWPKKYDDAEKCIRSVMGKDCMDGAYFMGMTNSYPVNAMEPATGEYLVKLNDLFKEAYEAFELTFKIPEVLADGKYIVGRHAIVIYQ